jgi:streptomycin 6-kinase
MTSCPSELRRRFDGLTREWRVTVDTTCVTNSSVLAFGSRDNRSVVLKVVKNEADEWRSGAILEAFGGLGVPGVYEHVGGAVLMERLDPGHSLAEMALGGCDDEATVILADVIAKLCPPGSANAWPSVEDRAAGFRRYSAGGDLQIPQDLVEQGHRVYSDLCVSQRHRTLLHGDLHHYNVLFDARRGWLAIDPKGVVGEIEYEIGAALRNPVERPQLFLQQSTIETRIEHFARKLKRDPARILAWAFAQAVLAAIWAIEDGFLVDVSHPFIALARTIRPML